MIACFPEIYSDELLYSQLARYYAQSGYTAYRYAAEDLYINKTVRPDIEFLNGFTNDALLKITQFMPMETIVENHTMFSYYSRFVPVERRNNAFQSLVTMQGNYKNLLVIPKRKTDKNRYVRYCPLCAIDDRKNYGETYWHREHQMQGVDICSIHGCYLNDSNLIISGKASPTLVTAEEIIPPLGEIIMCKNKLERKLVKYVTDVFKSDINMKTDVLAGDFLHSRMSGTKYRSVRGQQRNIALFHADFTEYYKTIPNNWFTELWQMQKVLTNDRINTIEICMMAMFLGIPAGDLVNMRLPDKTQEQLFDEQIYRLHDQGLKYPQIAEQLNAPLSTVKSIGEKKYGTYHKQPKKPLKSGAKPKDWKQIDTAMLQDVKTAIKELQGNGTVRPKKITVFAIEKMLKLSPKQIDNLPLCRAEIKKYYVSQQEYWAMEVVWAAKKVISEGKILNWKSIRTLTNMRRDNLKSCIPYLNQYTDDVLLIDRITGL